MTNQEMRQDRVGAAATTFAEIEQAHENLKALYDRLHRQIGECYEAGVGRHPEALQIRNGLEAARGLNSNALEKTLKIHARCTAVAVREGCDVPPALAISDGLVRPMDGGR